MKLSALIAELVDLGINTTDEDIEVYVSMDNGDPFVLTGSVLNTEWIDHAEVIVINAKAEAEVNK